MAELTEQEKAELEARVERGAALLDRELPDWRERVHVGALDMRSCALCVVGQVLGSYLSGMTSLGFVDGASHGFDCGEDDALCVWDYLDTLWTKEIQR